MLFTGRGHTASFTHIFTSAWPKFHLLSVRYLPDLYFWWTMISRRRSHCNVPTLLCNLTRITGCSQSWELLYCVTHWSFCKIPSRSLQTPQSAADHSVYILGFFLKRNGSSAGSWQPPRLVALQWEFFYGLPAVVGLFLCARGENQSCVPLYLSACSLQKKKKPKKPQILLSQGSHTLLKTRLSYV